MDHPCEFGNARRDELIFVLPAGYRPLRGAWFATITDGALGKVEVSGAIVVSSARWHHLRAQFAPEIRRAWPTRRNGSRLTGSASAAHRRGLTAAPRRLTLALPTKPRARSGCGSGSLWSASQETGFVDLPLPGPAQAATGTALAAVSMRFATSAGWETIAKWPAGTSIVVAPIGSANIRSRQLGAPDHLGRPCTRTAAISRQGPPSRR